MDIPLSTRELEFVIHKIGGRSDISTIKPSDDFSAAEVLTLISRLEAARVFDSMTHMTPTERLEALGYCKEDLPMGTKNNPGSFDCHASAEDDEPLFTLLARDRTAPHLVRLWAAIREGDAKICRTEFAALMVLSDNYRADPREKIEEAYGCSDAMETWRSVNRDGLEEPTEKAEDRHMTRLADSVREALKAGSLTIWTHGPDGVTLGVHNVDLVLEGEDPPQINIELKPDGFDPLAHANDLLWKETAAAVVEVKDRIGFDAAKEIVARHTPPGGRQLADIQPHPDRYAALRDDANRALAERSQ